MSTRPRFVHRTNERYVLHSALALLVCITSVACTKTTVHEAPEASGEAPSTGPFSDPVGGDQEGGVDGESTAGGTADGAGTDTEGVAVPPAFSDSTVTPSTTAQPNTGGLFTPVLPNAGSDTVVGQPGIEVDCAQSLPCRWSDGDESFAVSLTSADDTGPRNGLSINFQVDTTHDTEIVYAGGSDAVVDTGARPAAIARILGGGNGLSPVAAEAGTPITGRIDYAAPAAASMLTRWRVGLSDNGQVREAIFVNVPVGPALSAAVDCALTLPCIWTAADSSASLRLDAAGGLADIRRLSIGFTVVSGTALALALDGGAAIGADGAAFESRNLTLGDSTGYTTVKATTVANLNLGGNIDFRRVEGTPFSLTQLSLSIYPDAPVPRWQVMFENVPLL